MFDEKETWARITATLESDIPKSEVMTWFSDTSLKKLGPDLAEIEVPNKFVGKWLNDNYLSQIQNSFKTNLNLLPQIHFTCGKAINSQTTINNKNICDEELSLGRGHEFDPIGTFDTFITSNSNRLAYSSALEVATKPRTLYNPLYLFSKLSLGKTHLLHAICEQVAGLEPAMKARYFSMDMFSSQLSAAKTKGKLREFRENYKNVDFILLDDIHLVDGRTRLQEELVSLFNLFYESQKQIVLAADRPPNQINSLLPHLISRFEWGLLVEIQVSDQKTRKKIIRAKIKEENLHIPDDAIFFLANATNNIKELTQYLVALSTYASVNKRKIDMSTVKSIIKSRHHYKISVRNIQKATTQYYNISLSDLLSNKKSRKFSYPRQVAMYLTRRLTDLSLKQVGEAFGDKDHSTVIYAVNRIKKDEGLEKEVLGDINKIRKLLLGFGKIIKYAR
ncbi:MAG: chromosomal replication initiator protein DnaA [Desulfobacterales bacterium]|nr:chromosomal replication initiator protein DnaA [Desulfobacterales bacterium]